MTSWISCYDNETEDMILVDRAVSLITCEVVCDCVWSNSSNLMGLVVGMWNRDMTATLLHSVLTCVSAMMLSSLVSSDRKAKSFSFSQNVYSGTSELQPGKIRHQCVINWSLNFVQQNSIYVVSYIWLFCAHRQHFIMLQHSGSIPRNACIAWET